MSLKVNVGVCKPHSIPWKMDENKLIDNNVELIHNKMYRELLAVWYKSWLQRNWIFALQLQDYLKI